MADPIGPLHLQVLVVRCQLGDQEAFAELVARCRPRLCGFLRKMLRDPHSVDDIAQEVWLDVFQGLPRLVEPAAFLPWLYRIAHNQVYRLRRRRPVPVSLKDEADVAGDSDEVVFSAEEAQAVHAALDQLSEQYREVLLLRFMEQMSYEDIAGVVDCAMGTVRSRIHNGKAALRRIIESVKHP
jgi:RNA polymerase sigma-70 factor (ECF subfamily)